MDFDDDSVNGFEPDGFEDVPSPKKKPPREVIVKPKIVEKTVEKDVLSDKSKQILVKAVKDAKQLSAFLKEADYELTNFNRVFDKMKKFSYFKFTFSITAALVVGGLISGFVQKNLNGYYVQNEIQKMGIEQEKINLLNSFSVTVAEDGNGNLQVYVNKDKSSTWDNDTVNVLQINK